MNSLPRRRAGTRPAPLASIGRRFRPHQWHGFALLPAMVLYITGTAVGADLVALSADQQRAFGIELAAPARAEAALTRRYPAQVQVPNRQLQVVAAPHAGVIESLLVAEGERVAAGQVLARLRSPELVDAQSALLEAATRLGLANSELARDQMLFKEGVIAERRLLESRAHQKELATLVEQRRQLLELAGLSSADIDALTASRRMNSSLPVSAPIGGVVLEQMVSTGQSVAAAAPLYRVAELNPLWVEVHVPVDHLGGFEISGKVLLPSLGIGGTIITIGRMVHEEDQGVLVRAEVSEGAEQLRPGQFIEVQVATTTQAGNRWRVPSAALIRNAGKAYVFVARDGGFLAMPVKVLAEEEQSAVIDGALGTSDRIAVSGTVALKAAWLGASDRGTD
jgi:cobalt-zinc-cadmium efflux system membrane fusion protein